MCKPTLAARVFWGEGASLEGLATRLALVWFCEGWRLSIFSTWAPLLPIALSFLGRWPKCRGWCIAVGECVCLPRVTMGKSLESRSITQTAKPGLGEIPFLYRAGNVVSSVLA